MQQNSNFDINEQINRLIDEVVSGIKNNWPMTYKIRYIYLEVGKRLYKDVDFFFSADGKLGEDNLSISEIKDIYDSNIGRRVGKYLRVICKSASYILKLAYDRVGISSELVETNTMINAIYDDEEFLIYHWFLAINNTDDNEIYFATLTPDLPYIQMNMDTRHFGSDIPYKRDYNGKIMQIYKGNEIKHTVISREKLKQIDFAIGYIKNNYHYNDKGQLDNKWFFQYDSASLYMLKDSLRDNKLFYKLEIMDTSFYKSLIEFTNDDNKKISFIYSDEYKLTNNDWNCWIKILCKNVLEKIQEILGYEILIFPNIDSKHWNYELWLLKLCVQIQYDIFKIFSGNMKDSFGDITIDVENFKYSKWSKQVKNKFKIKKNNLDYDNIIVLLDKMNALVNCAKSNGKNGNINDLFWGIAYHFIEPDNLYENNISDEGFLSNYYIANKFNTLFQNIFSCNEGTTRFNQMGYAEKVTIIKEILLLMFPEVNKNNSYMLNGYDDNYSAILNRIQLYPIKNKQDGYYSILFNILGDIKSSDYYFLYNAKNNTFFVPNALDMYNDYIIVSNRMKNRVSIDDLEKIDEPINSKKK